MKICKYCGARLDAGEQCDCRGMFSPVPSRSEGQEKRCDWTYLGRGRFMCGACARLFGDVTPRCPACGVKMNLVHIIGEEIYFRELEEGLWQPGSDITGSN